MFKINPCKMLESWTLFINHLLSIRTILFSLFSMLASSSSSSILWQSLHSLFYGCTHWLIDWFIHSFNQPVTHHNWIQGIFFGFFFFCKLIYRQSVWRNKVKWTEKKTFLLWQIIQSLHKRLLTKYSPVSHGCM